MDVRGRKRRFLETAEEIDKQNDRDGNSYGPQENAAHVYLQQLLATIDGRNPKTGKWFRALTCVK